MSGLTLQGGFWRQKTFISAADIYHHAVALSHSAGWTTAPINDCADRADFATVLLAAAHSGYPCLLPSNSAPDALAQLQSRYPNAALMREVAHAEAGGAKTASCTLPITLDQTATIGFTSGSTGQPKPVSKSWQAQAGVALHVAELAHCWGMQGANVVATVPPQHTFGLEMTVMMALLGGWQVATARPFYPADIASTLASVSSNRLLVTTPVHLRTLLADATPLPELGMILSATAPLDAELAEAAENHFGCPVREIYGSTETGAIASRRTIEGDGWELLPRVTFSDSSEAVISADHLPLGTALPDRLKIHDPRHFTLLGRPEGMLKVGGKRSSTAAVQHALLSITGVQDAEVFLLPERDRPVALVVAPSLSAQQLRRELARAIDPVFIPRPIRCIEEIPRNATGKALRQSLLMCWELAAPRNGSGGPQA